MRVRWDEVEGYLVDRADGDLDRSAEVRPGLAAFAGDDLLFVAWLRPFEPHAYHDPAIELLALAVPLGADRLAAAFAGRAWSLDDPVAPVSPEGDLRQRVLILYMVDGTGGAVRAQGVVRPFDLTAGRPRWGEPRGMGGAEGWLPRALEEAVRLRGRLEASDADILAQATRVAALGHDLLLAPAVTQRLAQCMSPPN